MIGTMIICRLKNLKKSGERNETDCNSDQFPVPYWQRDNQLYGTDDSVSAIYCNNNESEDREMTWIVEYNDGLISTIDKVQGGSILEAMRNLIAKVGSDDIKFESVVKA